MSFGLGNFEAVIRNRHFVTTSINSLIRRRESALVALVIGWVTAWIVERTNAPLKGARLPHRDHFARHAVHSLRHRVDLVLRQGRPGQSSLSHAHRLDRRLDQHLLDARYGAGRGLPRSPLAFLLVGATLRNANPELEEAARVHGAGVWDTIRRVTMRLSLPSILALSMLVFIRAIEAFEVPALVGLPGRISVLTTDIYSNMVARAPPDIGGASALSVLMLGLVLVLLYIYGRLSRHAERFATIRQGLQPRPFDPRAFTTRRGQSAGAQLRGCCCAHADAGGVAVAVLPASERGRVQSSASTTTAPCSPPGRWSFWSIPSWSRLRPPPWR